MLNSSNTKLWRGFLCLEQKPCDFTAFKRGCLSSRPVDGDRDKHAWLSEYVLTLSSLLLFTGFRVVRTQLAVAWAGNLQTHEANHVSRIMPSLLYSESNACANIDQLERP